MVQKKKVAVIGGGISGLSAAKAFSERGHDVHGFERSDDLGGVWRPSCSYPDVKTQSTKDLYHFTDQEYDRGVPEWPKGTDVHAYLHSYAKKHDLVRLFRLNTTVQGMERRPDDQPGWTLTVNGGGSNVQEDFDFVSVATGLFSDKHVATHPGETVFLEQGGLVMHSSEYTDPSTMNGKHVLVLGASKSATDIAVNAGSHGAKSVSLVYRKNVWRVPHYVGGIHFKHLLYMRAMEAQFNGWLPSAAGRVLRTILKPLIWANFRGLETLLKFQLGLAKYGMVPTEPIEGTISCSTSLVTPGFFEALNDGKIRAVQASIEHFEDGAVILTNGETVPCDVAVMATGWKTGIPFLPAGVKEKLIDSDGLYRLYRFAVNPGVSDMGFVGLNSSFCSMLSSELVANWLVRYADGQLDNQPSADEMTAVIDKIQEWRLHDRPAAQAFGGQCTAPFHFRHFDELLRDIGATKWKRTNFIVELFVRPDTTSYGKFLASAPQYYAS